jgi:hypothetical protein
VSVEIEFTDEFAAWWSDLAENEQTKVSVSIELLRRFGIALLFPHSSGVAGSRHSQMRELRIQVEGRRYRVLYAFNPLRTAFSCRAATRRAISAGMRSTFRWPTDSTTST